MSSLSPVHTIGQQIIETIRLHRRVSKEEARDGPSSMLAQVKIPRPERASKLFLRILRRHAAKGA